MDHEEYEDEDSPQRESMRVSNPAQRRKPLKDNKQAIRAKASDSGNRKEALTLPLEKSSAYSTPGYYIVDRYGTALDGPYETYSLAISNLNGRDAIQYLDQDVTAPMNEPFPPTMNTVVGSRKESGSYSSFRNQSKEGDMSFVHKEAQLLAAMANNPTDAAVLMSELESLRAAEASRIASQREVDLANTYVADVMTPVVTHSLHTAHTDWLGDISTTPEAVASDMLTQASLWYQQTSPEVKADRDEFLTQAQGIARREASKHGEMAGEAYRTFMDHIDRIHQVHTANNETLLPWNQVLPPLPPSTPVGAEYNQDAVLTPGNPGQPQPLSNDAEHAYLFQPPSGSTPADMAEAGQVNYFYPNQDATIEPNDDGALSGAQRGPGNSVDTRGRTAAATPTSPGPYRPGQNPYPSYPIGGENIFASQPPSEAYQQYNPPTPEELAWASSRENLAFYPNQDETPEPNDDGADNYDPTPGTQVVGNARNARTANKYIKRQGDKWVITQKGTGKVLSHHDSEEEAQKAFAAMEMNKHSSQNFNGPKTTYDEYLAKISEGSYPIPRDLWDGMAAAVSPNDPTSRRQANFHEAGRKYSPRAGMPGEPVEPDRPWQATHIYEPIGWDWFDPRPHPDSDVIEPGSKVMDRGRMSPSGPGGKYFVHIEDENGNHQSVFSKSLTPIRSRKRAVNDYQPDPQGLDLGHNPAGWNYGPEDPQEAWAQSGMAQSGLPFAPSNDQATGWSNISDFPDTGPTEWPGNRAPNIQANMGPDEDEDSRDNSIDDSRVAAYRRMAVRPKDDEGLEEGYQTGGRGDVPGAYQPDRGLYAQSPQGQADSDADYEQAYSSGRQINWTDTGENVLGTVPVQGYEYNSDHPNGEMWPWTDNPPGSGAAGVWGVPTPGVQSQMATGTSWPQPTNLTPRQSSLTYPDPPLVESRELAALRQRVNANANANAR